MSTDEQPILIVRLGAMGDIIHALPAAASLKLSFPNRRLLWVAAKKWLPLLQGNPQLDSVIGFERQSVSDLAATWKRLRAAKPSLAIDFQGLIQSAIAGKVAGAEQFIGLDQSLARERGAAFFYTHPVKAIGPHRVERCLQLAAAAGATKWTDEAWLPEGRAEGNLPATPFVLANPFAGWTGKQWPIEYYEKLGQLLQKKGLLLVVNVPEARAAEVAGLRVHSSSISGLIYATRRATAIVGVDSGPLHIAAALKKPGVAIYGPTDPAQTGPFRSPMKVLRVATATTYKREDEIHASMRAITPQQVADELDDAISLS